MKSRENNPDDLTNTDGVDTEIDLSEFLEPFPSESAAGLTSENAEVHPASPAAGLTDSVPPVIVQVEEDASWLMADSLAQTTTEPPGPDTNASTQPEQEDTAIFVIAPPDAPSQGSVETAAQLRAEEEDLTVPAEDLFASPVMEYPDFVGETFPEAANAGDDLAAPQLVREEADILSPVATQGHESLEESQDSPLDEFLQASEVPFDRNALTRRPAELDGELELDLDFEPQAVSETNAADEEPIAAGKAEPAQTAPDIFETDYSSASDSLLAILETSAPAQGSRRCSDCGSQADAADLICVTCGAFLDEVEPQKVSENLCEDCGAAIEADELFCPSCGSLVSVV